MKEKRLEIIDKDDIWYPEEFVEWYITEGQFKYRFRIGIVPNPLAEGYAYWLKNVKEK